MQRRSWTVMVVPADSAASKSARVSERMLKTAVYALSAFLLATAIVSYVAISKTIDMSHLERLQRTNDLLAAELQENDLTLLALSDTIAAISERNRLVRNLAGLPPTDPAVLQAGVGGPASPLSSSDAFLQTQSLGQQALRASTDLDALLRRAHVLSSSFAEARDSLTDHTDRMRRMPSILPVSREVSSITSLYNPDRVHPIFHTNREHRGLDIAADEGTPILAPAAGVVIDRGYRTGAGLMVKIDHGSGIVTTFAHASEVTARIGQRVVRGQEIAKVGQTGWATGTHVHYEVEVNGANVDPRRYILPEDVVVD